MNKILCIGGILDGKYLPDNGWDPRYIDPSIDLVELTEDQQVKIKEKSPLYILQLYV